jgi:hypothetical protein
MLVRVAFGLVFVLIIGTAVGFARVVYGPGITAIGPAAPASTPTARPLPSPTPIPPPVSWLRHNTLLSIYGRAFGLAPILGRLGSDGSFADMQRQIQPDLQGIRSANGGLGVRVAVHLIYGLATPCNESKNCLLYLDDTGVNIVKQYIEPAARRGWLVVLDDQLGTSNPAAEVQRMISRGYLRYDNVEIALDPEFRAVAGQPEPGVPVGTVDAGEMNQAERAVNSYTNRLHLLHHKIVMVHQFQTAMITRRGSLRKKMNDVDLVIVADGFGTPGIKAHVYSTLLSRAASVRLRWRGIKLFYPNPYEQAGHLDDPLMTWQQVFGHAPAYDGTQPFYLRPAPNVIVIA